MASGPALGARVAHVVVVNQHGDNRGDEAAMRATIRALSERLAPARFTVLHQFSSPASEVVLDEQVEYVPMVPSVPGLVRLAAGVVLTRLGLPARGVLGRHGRRVLDAYRDADLVVSAPGGPYFGDHYWRHEPLHWLFAWMAVVVGVPSFLYAPSAGPFERRFMNPPRRHVLRGFTGLTVREQRSAEHVAALLRGARPVDVTADAAFQDAPPPMRRDEWFAKRPELASRRVVVVAAVDWSPRHRPGVSALVHDRSIVAALRALSVHDPVHVVLVPQLHGLHADRPYLERLAGHLGPQSGPRLSWEVLSDVHDSEVQRRLVAMSDLVVTGRYHPAVFAVAAGIPVICLAYEHKATGVMEAAGLDELVVAVEDVDEATLVGLVERVVADPPRHRVEAAARELRARSVRTAELAAALARPRP